MNTPLKTLFSIHGKFAGRGINHEGQAFTGTFDAALVGNRRGIRSLGFELEPPRGL
jgi:hypothetical protein